MILGNTFLVGAFGPVLPDIARTRGLADWQLGVVAGSFGFAGMAADETEAQLWSLRCQMR